MAKETRRSIRLPLSISSRNTNPEEWFKKAQKLTEKGDYRKGAYNGELNLSLFITRLVEEKYEEIYGNKKPSKVVIEDYLLVNIPEVKKDLDKRFLKKLRNYGDKRLLYRDMRGYIINVLTAIENREKRGEKQ